MCRFRRPRAEASHADPVVTARPALIGILRVGAAFADLLIVDVGAHLVLRRQLTRDAHATDLAARCRPLRDAQIGDVVPASGVAGIGVREASGDIGVCAEGPRHAVEPHLVSHDRAAHREARVPAPNDRGRRRDSERSEFIVHVVALRPLAGDVAEVGTAECVATGLRNEVELRAAAIGFAQSAGHRQLHFLRARRVVAVSGDAATVEGRADVHAVDLHRAFVAASATRREEDHVGRDTAVLDAVGLDARGDCQEIPVTSGRRQRCNDLVTEHALVAGAVLNVDDRCLTSHGQGFLQTADAHL